MDDNKLALQATMAATTLLVLKTVITMGIQGFNRFKTGFGPPEDASLKPAAGKQGFGLQERDDKQKEKLEKYQEIETRWQRIVMNDLENIPIGLITAWGALQCTPASSILHAILVSAFALARVGHTYFYAKAVQPHRAYAWVIGILSVVGIAANGMTGALEQSTPYVSKLSHIHVGALPETAQDMSSNKRLATFGDFQRSIDDLFRDFARDFEHPLSIAPVGSELSLWGAPARDSAMRMDVVERDDHYGVHVDLPGISKEDVKITLEGDMLTISAERTIERKEDKESYHMQERRYGKMSRSLRLPKDSNVDAAEAKFENGELNLTIPRVVKKSEATKTIQIK